MQPEDFGWKIVDGKLTPVMMTNPIAPDCLLNIFKCGCQGDCRTKKYSCFKNGLECSSACTECRGMACLNSPHMYRMSRYGLFKLPTYVPNVAVWLV